MFRGLTRLFRFRLHVANLRVESFDGYFVKERLVGDWSIIDRKKKTSCSMKLKTPMTRREARKALRWWRRFGD